MIRLALAFLLLALSSAQAQEIADRASVIDAPEGGQHCQKDGKPWRCAQASDFALDGLLQGRRFRLHASRYRPLRARRGAVPDREAFEAGFDDLFRSLPDTVQGAIREELGSKFAPRLGRLAQPISNDLQAQLKVCNWSANGAGTPATGWPPCASAVMRELAR
jgi:hypothetical protein